MSETLVKPDIATQTINQLRLLANQMITKAGSGHPGIALGAAPMLYELYTNQLVVDPAQPVPPIAIGLCYQQVMGQHYCMPLCMPQVLHYRLLI